MHCRLRLLCSSVVCRRAQKVAAVGRNDPYQPAVNLNKTSLTEGCCSRCVVQRLHSLVHFVLQLLSFFFFFLQSQGLQISHQDGVFLFISRSVSLSLALLTFCPDESWSERWWFVNCLEERWWFVNCCLRWASNSFSFAETFPFSPPAVSHDKEVFASEVFYSFLQPEQAFLRVWSQQFWDVV